MTVDGRIGLVSIEVQASIMTTCSRIQLIQGPRLPDLATVVRGALGKAIVRADPREQRPREAGEISGLTPLPRCGSASAAVVASRFGDRRGSRSRVRSSERRVHVSPPFVVLKKELIMK